METIWWCWGISVWKQAAAVTFRWRCKWRHVATWWVFHIIYSDITARFANTDTNARVITRKWMRTTQVHREAHKQSSRRTQPSTPTWTRCWKCLRLPGGLSLLPLRRQKWIICYWFPRTLPPLAYSSQLDFRIPPPSTPQPFFCSHFHKSLLIDPRVAPDSGVSLLFGFQAVAGFVPWLFTGRTGLWHWLIST